MTARHCTERQPEVVEVDGTADVRECEPAIEAQRRPEVRGHRAEADVPRVDQRAVARPGQAYAERRQAQRGPQPPGVLLEQQQPQRRCAVREPGRRSLAQPYRQPSAVAGQPGDAVEAEAQAGVADSWRDPAPIRSLLGCRRPVGRQLEVQIVSDVDGRTSRGEGAEEADDGLVGRRQRDDQQRRVGGEDSRGAQHGGRRRAAGEQRRGEVEPVQRDLCGQRHGQPFDQAGDAAGAGLEGSRGQDVRLD